ncbi:MAG: transcriptional regulator NrdR [Candidatus Nomurabacteria bacterium]|jgi:transcriptional repressor NrdR|nr:transcriptional regulator NrdR [Candidatus Nomurabacteria bacterium]
MHCSKCGGEESRVIESRDTGSSIRRRRECIECGHRYTTYERLERPNLAVIKKDGRKVLFDRQKLFNAIQRSVGKFLDSEAEVEDIVARVEDNLYGLGELEVMSRQIGDFVMEQLANRNEVAYIRFASVYREFKTADEFVETLHELRKKSDSTSQK